MAIFDLMNAAGRGFDMSGTNAQGWSYVEADPYVTTELTYDDGSIAIFDVYGSAFADQFGVSYSVDGDQWTISDAAYAKYGQTVLTISDLNLQTTTADLEAGAWAVRLNSASDVFYGNDFRDIIRAGYGNDQVLGYNGNDALYGEVGTDYLYGMYGNDYVDGGTGADTMNGGYGNDILIVDNTGDKVIEASGQGTDTVYASVSFALAAGQHVEALRANAGTAAINLFGNEVAQTIAGNVGANTLYGGGGNDVINGLAGNDLIYGTTGNDTLTGGAGYDRFVFNTAINSVSNVDWITDFNAPADTILLDNAVMAALGGAMEAGEFWKSTSGLAHDGNDRIIYETDTGWLNYDSNGSAAGGAVHIATLAPNLALSSSDFLVI